MPQVKGIDTFQGEMFHSARWKHDYDLTNKRVAVSAQVHLQSSLFLTQPDVKELIVFQRTAPWVLPKADLALNDAAKGIIAKYPVIQQLWRGGVAQILNGLTLDCVILKY